MKLFLDLTCEEIVYVSLCRLFDGSGGIKFEAIIAINDRRLSLREKTKGPFVREILKYCNWEAIRIINPEEHEERRARLLWIKSQLEEVRKISFWNIYRLAAWPVHPRARTVNSERGNGGS